MARFAIAAGNNQSAPTVWPFIPGTIGHCTLNPDNELRAWTSTRQRVAFGKWNHYVYVRRSVQTFPVLTHLPSTSTLCTFRWSEPLRASHWIERAICYALRGESASPVTVSHFLGHPVSHFLDHPIAALLPEPSDCCVDTLFQKGHLLPR